MFPFDNMNHCFEWYNQYVIVLLTIAGIAVLIIIGNVSVETIIQSGAQFTRPVNEQKIVTQSIRAISWIQFINLGLILFVINMTMESL
jgi:hypothetical protein